MIFVKFKNLEKSELAQDAVHERLETLLQKFPDLKQSRLQVTLEMLNSPTQAGPDLFNVKLHVLRARYDGVIVEKANSNLYVALADVVEHMLEKLNRVGDRARVKERRNARQLSRESFKRSDPEEQKTG